MTKRILVVDDDPTNIDLLTLLLRAVGHDPVPASSGREALAIASGNIPDLVLCDVQMPEMDGLDVLRRWREDRRMDGLRIIAMTAMALVGDRERLLKAGFDGYIAKPIDPESFIRDLERYLPAQPVLPYGAVTGPAAEPAPPSPPRVTGYVLLIDDLAVERQFLQGLLGPRGYEVIPAANAAAALAIAAERDLVLVMCDVQMPQKNGFATLEELRTLPGFAAVPFIFLTSAARPGGRPQQGLSMEATKFLTRPIEPEALLSEMQSLLENEP